MLTTPRPLAEHLNAFRGLVESDDQRTVPNMAFASFYKHVSLPPTSAVAGVDGGGKHNDSEGFDDIVEVPFVPHPPSDPAKRKLFGQFLV